MSPLDELPVPPYWTAEQAAAVHELLEVLQQVVWRVHGADIVRLYEAQTEVRCDRGEDEHDDRDIPF